MAKDKSAALKSGDRDLGEVKKKLTSGMFETSKGEKIPPFPGVQIGSKMKLEKHRFVIVDGKKAPEPAAVDALSPREQALLERVEALEAKLGEKGAAVKAPATTKEAKEASQTTTPPKVGA